MVDCDCKKLKGQFIHSQTGIFIRDGVSISLAAVVITYSVGHNHVALRKASCVHIGFLEGASGARSMSDVQGQIGLFCDRSCTDDVVVC